MSAQLPVTVNPYPRWLTKGSLLLIAFSFFYLLWEWFTIGVIAKQEKIESYMFGSETMLREGGKHYASAETYATSALHGACWLLPLIVTFALAVNKGTTPYRWLAVASVILVNILAMLFN
jgi:hypothetical protein